MIRVAVIGTGNIGPFHIRGYLAFPDRCKIVALCDIYPEKAEQKKAEFGLTDATVCASHRDLLDRDDIDLVSICTPPYTHAEIAIDFMNAGKNVLVEKPMASSLEECDRMLEAEQRTGKTMGIIAQNRFTDPVMKLKRVLDSGLAGRIVHAQVDSLWWRGHCYYDLWWRGCWEKEGGGCTLNHAVHHIDMLGWLMGPPQKVTAVLSNANHDNAEVEDISIAIMQYRGGGLARVTSSVIDHGEEQKIVFQGEHAKISAPWNVYASCSMPNGFPTENHALEQQLNDLYQNLPSLQHTGHEGEIENVLTALEQGKRPLICGQDGRLAVEIISAIYQAGFSGTTVSLPMTPKDSFYTAKGIQTHARHFYEKGASLENMESGGFTVGEIRQEKESGGEKA